MCVHTSCCPLLLRHPREQSVLHTIDSTTHAFLRHRYQACVAKQALSLIHVAASMLIALVVSTGASANKIVSFGLPANLQGIMHCFALRQNCRRHPVVYNAGLMTQVSVHTPAVDRRPLDSSEPKLVTSEMHSVTCMCKFKMKGWATRQTAKRPSSFIPPHHHMPKLSRPRAEHSPTPIHSHDQLPLMIATGTAAFWCTSNSQISALHALRMAPVTSLP